MSNKRYIEYCLDSSHILIQDMCTSQVLFCLKAEPEMGIPQASSSLKGNNSSWQFLEFVGQSLFLCYLTACSWASDYASLSLSFLYFKMVQLKGLDKNQIKY